MDRVIITEKVKQNKRFLGNEDLLDSIVNLVLERIEGVCESIKDEDAVNVYIDKTIAKSVMDVLKQEGRYRVKSIEKFQKIDYKIFAYDNWDYKKGKLPLSKLKQIYSMLKKSDKTNGTCFLEILKLRFRDKQSFEKISSNIDIPTDKLVDAFFDMAEYSDKVARL